LQLRGVPPAPRASAGGCRDRDADDGHVVSGLGDGSGLAAAGTGTGGAGARLPMSPPGQPERAGGVPVHRPSAGAGPAPMSNGSDERTTAADAPPDLAAIVGENLRRLRTRQGHSLERLAKLSGVSRAMLSQIELGRSVPTIAVLWKITHALGVPFAALTSP